MSALLSVQNIDLAYDDNLVIDKLSVQIEAGSFVGLIGPNGAGKSTLMLALSAQFRPQHGTIFSNDLDIYGQNYIYKQTIGFVHEAPFFYSHLTVAEFLWFVARVKGMQKKEIDEKINSILRPMRLYDERDKATSQLSQGMRKKLAIAAAMINTPNIVFLDEALNGVDVESAFHIKKLLADYVTQGGTVILSTHVLEIIEKLCDRYLILKQGKIVADLDEESLKNDSDSIALESHVLRILKA